MCFLECSASLGSPCFRFAIAKVGRFGILAKRCDLFFFKNVQFCFRHIIYILRTRWEMGRKVPWCLDKSLVDCVEDGIGRRGGRVAPLGECGAKADA